VWWGGGGRLGGGGGGAWWTEAAATKPTNRSERLGENKKKKNQSGGPEKSGRRGKVQTQEKKKNYRKRSLLMGKEPRNTREIPWHLLRGGLTPVSKNQKKDNPKKEGTITANRFGNEGKRGKRPDNLSSKGN